MVNTDTNRPNKMVKTGNIKLIRIGKFELKAWLPSYTAEHGKSYPSEHGKNQKLWICEYCLKYMTDLCTYRNHIRSCTVRQPPGKGVYRKDKICVYEVDGKEQKTYCQNLCLLSKLYLKLDALYYDVCKYWFFVMCEIQHSAHIVGYFVKEKLSAEKNMCFLFILPQHRHKGYVRFLIEFSYELSKIEHVVASPEKPLPSWIVESYRYYWIWSILNILHKYHGKMTLIQLSRMTCINLADVITTLKSLNMVKYVKNKWIFHNDRRVIKSHIDSVMYKPPKIAVDWKIRWVAPKRPAVFKRPSINFVSKKTE